MRTKVFKGESLPAVLLQVRQEFGQEAIIINTRECGTHQIEVEVGWWVEGEGVEQLFYEEQPSLGTLADMSMEADIAGALTAQGLSGEIRDFCKANLPTKGDTAERLAKALTKVLVFDGSMPFQSRSVLVVGPPQSGKTTTLLKLAARLREALGCKVGIVSADEESDAKRERLTAYSDLLEMPISFVDAALPAAERIPAAASCLEESDLILIDTPGADPRNDREHLHLSRLLRPCRDMEKLLIVPASQDIVSLRVQLQRFESYGCSRLVLTKIDRCGRLGPTVNAICESDLPLGFFGAGDRIPQDIEPASPRKLAALLLRRMH
jgi:flagellar biosynthesis protein FlhF